MSDADHDLLVEIRTDIGYIKKNIQEHSVLLNNHCVNQEISISSIHNRISKLENWRNYIGGSLVIISGLVTMVYAFILKRLS